MKLIEERRDKLTALSDEIWRLAEVGLHENQSSELLASYLEEEGFSVTRGVADMPSAFVAEFGTGKPVIAILGEYDALPGLSQNVATAKNPVQKGAPGHGCGHNLLGVAAAGAAVAAKHAMQAEGLSGTVRFYGCPAEETLVGKVFMVREGLFADVDCALTWHPGSLNSLWAGSSLALNSVKFTFHGRTAHAAGDPHSGRSALDAVELMNVAANYLREHIVPEARIHYCITNGGGEPNIVPGEAEVWYYVRAPKRKQVDEIYGRLVKCAEGAALMTETSFETEFLAACYNTLHNDALGDLLMEKMEQVGPPGFKSADYDFAWDISKTFPEGLQAARDRLKDLGAPYTDKILCDFVVPPYDKGKVSSGSTDVGDVSYVVPTAQFTTACNVLGTPGHSWQYTAAAGMGIGHAGMIAAAKILGEAALELMKEPALLEKARKQFGEKTSSDPYTCPLPPGAKPPLHQLKH
jgi:aminobenzoyl-glutamate utilization protein B